MELYYKKLGEGDPLFIIHGLFGASDNWYTLGKRYAEDFTVYLIDLRNHGKSPHSDEHSYEAMAEDLLNLIYEEQLMFVNIIGHSMGGKVAMKFAEMHPTFVEKMIVGDIGPKQYQPHHQLVLKALNAFMDSEINTRKEAEKLITSIIDDRGVAMFLLKNLYWKNPGDLQWKMNVPVLEQNMENILVKVPSEQVEVDTLFLRGSESNYIQDQDFDEIHSLFPESQIITIPEAGHWLHAEQPQLFYDESMKFLDE